MHDVPSVHVQEAAQHASRLLDPQATMSDNGTCTRAPAHMQTIHTRGARPRLCSPYHTRYSGLVTKAARRFGFRLSFRVPTSPNPQSAKKKTTRICVRCEPLCPALTTASPWSKTPSQSAQTRDTTKNPSLKNLAARDAPRTPFSVRLQRPARTHAPKSLSSKSSWRSTAQCAASRRLS